MLVNSAILAIFKQITSPEIGLLNNVLANF